MIDFIKISANQSVFVCKCDIYANNECLLDALFREYIPLIQLILIVTTHIYSNIHLPISKK